MRPATARIHPALVVFVAASTPIALGVESLARALLLPREFDEVRAFLAPVLEVPAFVLVLVTLVCGALGFVAQGRMLRSRRAQAAGDGATVATAVFLAASSIVQLPALAASVLFMFGAPLGPTLLTIGLSVLVVMAQGFVPRAKETQG